MTSITAKLLRVCLSRNVKTYFVIPNGRSPEESAFLTTEKSSHADVACPTFACEDVNVITLIPWNREMEATAAIQRVKDQPGFTEYSECFQIHPYQLNRDSWTKGYIVD